MYIGRIYWSLLNFMELYILWRKFKRWGLLMFGWNVILFWFMLRLLLGPMFLECVVIDGIHLCGKIRFGVTHVFPWREYMCRYKLVNLGFIHKESFNWYNRLSSSMSLEFFMNSYSLPMYRFLLTYKFWSNPHIFIFFNNIFFRSHK